MRRWLFNIIAAISLLLFVGITVLWVSSYFATTSVRYTCTAFEVRFLTEQGLLQIDSVKGNTGDPTFGFNDYRRCADWGRKELNTFKEESALWHPLSHLDIAAWSYGRITRTHSIFDPLSAWCVFVPLWLVVLLAAILPTWQRWRRHRLKQLRRAGICLACGYDLRASKDRCPECGTQIPVREAAA